MTIREKLYLKKFAAEANNQIENKSGIGNYIKKLLGGSIAGGAIGGLSGGIKDYNDFRTLYSALTSGLHPDLDEVFSHIKDINKKGVGNMKPFGARGALAGGLAGLLTAIYQGRKSDK